MWQSLKYSNLFLRLGLAFVFFWFGIDKFFHPGYWLNAWVPASIVQLAGLVYLSANALVYAIGVFELLVGTSSGMSLIGSDYLTVALVNQTDFAGNNVNSTAPVQIGSNITIRINVTATPKSVSNVWVAVWQAGN